MADSILQTQPSEEVKPTPDTNTAPVEPNPAPEKTIILSGPLSNIYTQALQVAFSKDTPISIVNETNAVDAGYILKQQKENEAKVDVPLFVKVDTDPDNTSIPTQPNIAVPSTTGEAKPLFVYVTNDENLSDKGLSNTFNDLRIALSKENYSQVILCMDDGTKLTKRQLILEEYVNKEPNGKAVYSQKGLINYLI